MHTVKSNSGARIPALGLGTWRLEGASGQAAIEKAIATGYRHIDTAQMYGNEREVGAAVAASGVGRREMFLTTKIHPDAMSPELLVPSVERSVQALGGPSDLLLIHWPSRSVPLERTLASMLDCRDRGLTRALGVCNFPVRLLKRALRLAPISCNQIEYHPYLAQTAMRDLCRAEHVVMVAYCPLAKGLVLRDKDLIAIARRKGRSVAQVVLRWLVQQHGVAAIPKSSDPVRIAENFALDFVLDQQDMASISSLARRTRLVDPPFAPAW